MVSDVTNLRSKLTTILLVSLVITFPIWITLLLTTTLLHLDFRTYIPSHDNTFNDAILYWRQIYSFSQAGFNAGYYTLNELPAPSALSHYFFYGPFLPMIYGSIGRVFGWYSISMVVINLIFVTCSIAVFIFTTRPTQRQLLLLLVMLLTFWPLILFLPATMQEGLHMSIAFILAAAFWVLLKQREKTPLWLKITLFFFIAVASLLRILWGFFFIPYFLLITNDSKRLVRSFFFAALSGFVCFIIFSYFSAPYSEGFLYNFTKALKSDMGGAVAMFAHQIGANLKHLIADDLAPNIVELVFRAQYIGIILILLVAVFREPKTSRWLRKPKEIWNNLISMPPEKLLNLANLAAIFVVIILLYEVLRWREYRSMSPHLLFTLLLLIAYRQNRLVIAVIVAGLIALPTFLSTYSEWGPDFKYDQTRIESFGTQVNDVLVFDPTATNAWCNTILVSLDDQHTMHPEIMAMDPGIGFSYFAAKDPLTSAPKSKYLLIPSDVAQKNAKFLNTKLLKTTQVGNLYLNLAANCNTSTAQN